MPNNNASSVLFGWDFQINSAIVLMLDNIQVADDVRVEGDTEDIELYLNNGEKIFSQAKSIVRIDDYSNVIAKLKNSLRSLSNANHSDVAKLIYVTNTPNPFNNTETMSAFYGHTRISYSDLPTICKNKIDEIVDELNLDNFEQTKFHIHIIPFFTDNFDERPVAGGMVPIASGGDGGGSIRIPSSCCALFGLKPTRGRNPTGPEHGAIWQGAVVEHIITRSVRDSAAMLDATCGTDVGAPYIIPVPERPYMEEIKKVPGSLRIAFNTRSPLDTEVHPECVEAVEETARLLEGLGHTVVEDRPAIDGKALATSYFTMYMGEIAADIEELELVLGRKAKKGDVEALTWTFNLLGRSYSAGYFVEQLRQWGMASRAMGRFHEQYDLYLTPTVAFPPVRVGELQPKPAERALLGVVNALGGVGGKLLKLSGVMETIAVESLSKTPFTQLANFTGQPAMSVPLHWTAEGLPCGVQFIGRFGDEATLFRLAAQLEQAQPWFDRRPPVVG